MMGQEIPVRFGLELTEEEVKMGELGIPMGFRFKLTDEEVITMLRCLEAGEGLSFGTNGEVIEEADVYGEDEPWELLRRFGKEREKVTYFTTILKRKFLKGDRICRTVGRTKGCWSTQNTKPVIINTSSSRNTEKRRRHNNIIGWKRSLRYENKSNPAQTCQWIMAEYTLREESKPNDLVVCRIKNKREEDEEQHVPSSSTLFYNNPTLIIPPQRQEDPPATVTTNVDDSTTKDAYYYYNQHGLGNAVATAKPVVNELQLPRETITTVGDQYYYSTPKEDGNANANNNNYCYSDQLILESGPRPMAEPVVDDYYYNNDHEFQLPKDTITTIGDQYYYTTPNEVANANANNNYCYSDQLILDSSPGTMARPALDDYYLTLTTKISYRPRQSTVPLMTPPPKMMLMHTTTTRSWLTTTTSFNEKFWTTGTQGA